MKHLKLCTLALASLLIATTLVAQQTTKDWVFNSGGQWSDQANAIVTDSQGNIYATGSFQGKMNVKNQTLKSEGDTDIFIAKFNKSGELIWAKKAGSKVRKRNTITEYGSDLVLVDDEYLYVTGVFSLNADFDHLELDSKGQDDIFIAKYTANGDLKWVRSAGGSSQDIAYSLDADSQGNIYLTGSFQKQVQFGDILLESTNLTETFVAKLNATGKFLWAKQSFSKSMSTGKSIKCDDDYCILAGEYKGEMKILNSTLSSQGKEDLFFTRLDLNGNLEWIKTIGGKGVEMIGDLAVKNDKIYFVGNSNESFQGLPQTEEKKDAIIGSFFSDGSLNWLNSFGGNGNDLGKALAITENEEIFVIGTFEKNIVLDEFELISTEHQSAFILSMDKIGKINWGEDLGGSAQNNVNDISIENGDIYATGFMRGQIHLFGERITSMGSSDMYFLKLNNIYEVQEVDVKVLDKVCIYPNPSNGIFTIRPDFVEDEDNLKIDFFNMQGALLFSRTYSGEKKLEIRVDASGFGSGLYMLNTTFNGQSITKRVILK